MNNIIITLFIVVILNHELNFGYYFRKFFKIRISKPIKPLDCFPCFTFWISIIIMFILNDNLMLPISTFLIAKIYDTISTKS